MSLTQYYTATSLDGFIADPSNSLDWLFTRAREEDGPLDYGAFVAEVGAIAMGSTTYEWLLDHVEEWPYELPCWVFTHRRLRVGPGARIDFVSGDVAPVHERMVAAAGGRNVWIVGGETWRVSSRTRGSSTRCSCRSRRSRSAPARRCCRAGSSYGWRSSGGTATSSPRGSPSCAPFDAASSVVSRQSWQRSEPRTTSTSAISPPQLMQRESRAGRA